MGLPAFRDGLGVTGTILLLGVAGMTLTACAQDAEGEVTGDVTGGEGIGSDADIPSIYVDRTIELQMQDGVNRLREGYQSRVSACQEAGFSTKPLGEADAARLGTERWQFWRTPGRLAYRTESWVESSGDVAGPERCHFSLLHEGEHGYHDRERSVFVDLETGERSVESADPEMLEVHPFEAPDAGGLAQSPDWSGPLTQSVQGQPCEEWRSPHGAVVCNWSGGAQWGFSHEPSGTFGSNAGMSLGGIVLKAEPPPGKIGDRLTTTQFVIDATIDPASMMPDGAVDGG
jgi:hypothetical protein